MSTAPSQPAPADPTPSPLPVRPAEARNASSTRLSPEPGLPTPKLRLEIRDLAHPGTLVFLATTNATTVLTDAITVVLQTLYVPFEGNADIPPVRSITLVLRSMDGVAYTTGTELDDEHKEIHFSLDYIANIPKTPSRRQRDEIEGVLVHELVHCWQWNALGTAPGGLIEGIADFVRLRASLSPPHWKKERGGDWDAGYQHTGYFLDWIESKYGDGSVMKINERLKNRKYEESKFWEHLFGNSVGSLWKDYMRSLDEQGASEKQSEPGELQTDDNSQDDWKELFGKSMEDMLKEYREKIESRTTTAEKSRHHEADSVASSSSSSSTKSADEVGVLGS